VQWLGVSAVSDAVSLDEVVVYVEPKRHIVQYSLRHGEMFNQVAVSGSPEATGGQAGLVDARRARRRVRADAALRLCDRGGIGYWAAVIASRGWR
jgi:hypothetical protein